MKVIEEQTLRFAVERRDSLEEEWRVSDYCGTESEARSYLRSSVWRYSRIVDMEAEDE